MSCFGQLRVGRLPYTNVFSGCFQRNRSNVLLSCFRREQREEDTELEKAEIVGRVVGLVMTHIGHSYSPDPRLVQQTEREIENYINLKVAERFREQVEFHGLREKMAAITRGYNAKMSSLTLPEEASSQRSYDSSDNSLEEIPLDKASEMVPIVSTHSAKAPKGKSLLKKIFKFRPKRSRTETNEGSSKRSTFVQRMFKGNQVD